ncbi:hypothetical protein P7K49_035604, partial [Saguinus oedipus]
YEMKGTQVLVHVMWKTLQFEIVFWVLCRLGGCSPDGLEPGLDPERKPVGSC